MAATNIIRVPKPASGSFNPNRPIAGNTLLRNQVEHFRKLELLLPAEKQTGVQFGEIKTEGQASDYIRKMTGILHPQVAKSGGR